MLKHLAILVLALFSVSASAADVIAISCGSSVANGSFSADEDFAGGTTFSTTDAINLSNVANPAPTAVYQSNRYGNFTYTVPGLTPGAIYQVRLHFAEVYWNAAGDRIFDVALQGTQVLTNFDIYAASGGQAIANVQQFQAAADANGNLAIQFTSVKDNAQVNGIEVSLVTPPVPPAYNLTLSPDKAVYTVGDAATIILSLSGTPKNQDYDFFASATYNGSAIGLTNIANGQSYAVTPALASGTSTFIATVFLENKARSAALNSAISSYNSAITSLNAQLAATNDPNTQATLRAEIAQDQDLLSATEVELANSRTQVGSPAILNLFAH